MSRDQDGIPPVATVGPFAMDDDWPGRSQREPSLSSPHFLVLAPLVEQLRARIARHLRGQTDLHVLDIGCGYKPYMPLFAGHAKVYRGIDLQPGPMVDDVGEVEALPYEDRSFDVVVCTQVMEHVRDPIRAATEIHRVLAPGGLALVSTHGVALYHPDPPRHGRDLWRWTHTGLETLFRDTGDWGMLEVTANGDAIACIGYVLAQYADEGLARIVHDRFRAAAISAFNRVVLRLDRRYPPHARVPRPGSLSANFLLTGLRDDVVSSSA